MTNPISATSATQLPPISYPLIDQSSGGPTVAWYQAFLAFYNRTGSASGLNNTDISTAVQAAQTTANEAAFAAASAHTLASNALTEATQAASIASTAEGVAEDSLNLATSVNSAAMFKANNLGDVASLTNTRRTLGVAQYPLTFHANTLTTGYSYCTPIIQALTLPVNLPGSLTFARVAPTHNATFVLNYWRNGLSYGIGAITLTAGSHIAFTVSSIAVSLLAGDVVELVTPLTVDGTLANVGITLSALLV